MRIGLIYERIRKDEKALLDEITRRGHEAVLIDATKHMFRLEETDVKCDVALERCISHARGYYSVKILNEHGIRTLNSSACAEVCGDKFLVTEALLKSDIPTPKTILAFTREGALGAIEKMGYPVVLKPAIGSWGTLCAKVNDRDAAEAILDHKEKLGSYHHSVFYIQEYIRKPGRDIRVFVVGDKVVAAVYRESDHWMTNIEGKYTISECEITDEIRDLALRSARAVKGDIVAVDMLEGSEGILVNEINYTVEFSLFSPVVPLSIVKDMVDLAEEVGKR